MRTNKTPSLFNIDDLIKMVQNTAFDAIARVANAHPTELSERHKKAFRKAQLKFLSDRLEKRQREEKLAKN